MIYFIIGVIVFACWFYWYFYVDTDYKYFKLGDHHVRKHKQTGRVEVWHRYCGGWNHASQKTYSRLKDD